MVFFIQTVVLVAVFYFVPWLGDFQGSARLALMTAGGAIGSAALMFLWDLAAAPVRLDRLQAREIARLIRVIRSVEEADAAVQDLARLLDVGRDLLRGAQAGPAALTALADWAREVEAVLEARFEAAALYQFRLPFPQVSTAPQAGSPAHFAAQVDALAGLVRTGAHLFRGEKFGLGLMAGVIRTHSAAYLEALGVDPREAGRR